MIKSFKYWTTKRNWTNLYDLRIFAGLDNKHKDWSDTTIDMKIGVVVEHTEQCTFKNKII